VQQATVDQQQQHGPGSASLNRLALSATTHCLTGCAIGEVSGMAIATAERLVAERVSRSQPATGLSPIQ